MTGRSARETHAAQTRVRRWLVERALPLWATCGVDPEHGGFFERLSLDGTPDVAVAKRVRVQARQIYVYSHAALLGLAPDGVAIAALGHRFLLDHAMPDGVGSGVVHALRRDGFVLDDRRDSYDHAFVLFALSWYSRASGDVAARALLRPLAETTWRLLSHPGGEGLLVDDRGGLELHQNPHMHLLEAVLAAHEATGDGWFLERAAELVALFRERMLDRERGVLREFFDVEWQPVEGARGLIVEPGHHCEWIWLLKRHADRTGTVPGPETRLLARFVERYGRPNHAVLLCDQLDPDGVPLKRDTRSWPQTEAIKADIALAEVQGRRPGARTAALVDAVFERFLDPAVPGGWIDWTDEAGVPLVRAIPASTFYHLFLAFAEYLGIRDAV